MAIPRSQEKVDATTSEMLQKQKAMLEEEKQRYEHQAQLAAQEAWLGYNDVHS